MQKTQFKLKFGDPIIQAVFFFPLNFLNKTLFL